MGGLSCNACNVEFMDEAAQRAHYRSEWHRHNLKRKVAGVPGVSEALFNMRLEALAAEKKNQDVRMTYTCSTCNKSYSSERAHGQHLQSKLHVSKASGAGDSTALVRPAPVRTPSSEVKLDGKAQAVESESEDEWEEVDGEDIQSIADEEPSTAWNPAQCFFCDGIPDGTLEGCVEHMHREHGFFIPDAEYLKDARGMLNYLGLKVTEGFMCLYCDERGKRYQSLESVRKHMIAKSHCKLRYGEEGGGAEDELEEFYDFSESYKDHGGELMAVDQDEAPVALTSGGFELVIRGTGEAGTTKTLGSRELHRYYKQKHRPIDTQTNRASVNAVIAKYRNMGLATREPKAFVHAKETRNLPSVRLENMRSKLGMKNNVIRNLPKNCTH